MIIDTLNLLKNDCPKLRVKITERLRKKLFFCLNSSTESLARLLKINEVSLRRKLLGTKGYSLELNELLFLAQKAKIDKKEILSNVADIKIGANAYWSNVPMKILIDENFAEGIGYYIGDGRLKTNRGLSAVSIDIDTIKFFLNWIIKYIGAQTKNIRVNISLPRSSFNTCYEKRKWSKLLGINNTLIRSKHRYKNHHKTLIEIRYSRTVTKLILDRIIPRTKEKCLLNKSLATAYIRGIMAAEGSPRYNKKSHQRAIHLKMKDKAEVEYVFKLLQLLDCIPSLVFSRHDEEWIVCVSNFYELKKLEGVKVFKFNMRKREKLRKILKDYHHKQSKKGLTKEFYLNSLLEFEKKNGKYCTAKQLSKYINRDKTRVIYLLRKLQKGGLLKGEQIVKTGRPFKFTLTKTGKNLIATHPLLAYQPH